MHRSLIAYPIIQFDEMALQYRHRFLLKIRLLAGKFFLKRIISCFI